MNFRRIFRIFGEFSEISANFLNFRRIFGISGEFSEFPENFRNFQRIFGFFGEFSAEKDKIKAYRGHIEILDMGGSIRYTLRYTKKSDISAFDKFSIRYSTPCPEPVFQTFIFFLLLLNSTYRIRIPLLVIVTSTQSKLDAKYVLAVRE